ncbi:cupin domain-containing protein [Chitinophaga rhizophila]|uniref:Cupin domain-containing protein n=1 Tax=Chitinophaga rhizophila TaxID=2866212 RepID=A0ABS7GE96_9BACT|nr:cupin domain-containing protein [Chitinophaga rhizophila]MBW8685992.1 cupin domain-containing protein [Chitinophaga rhizophila]
MMTITHDMTFEHLIAPLDRKTFFNEYFEKKPFVIKRENSQFFASLLQLKDIEAALLADDILSKVNMRMVKLGDPIPAQDYIQIEKVRNVEIRNKLLLDEVSRLFNEEKATFVLEQTKSLWPTVSHMLSSINEAFCCSSNTNIYISPPGACGFAIHYDSHDVFVMQIAGAKHWKIYNNPFYLPLGIHNSLPFKTEDLELLYDLEVEAGDTIYLPRGFVHEASTSHDLSAHITAGIYNTTLAKVLSDYVISLAGREGILRESVLALVSQYEGSEADLLAKIGDVLTSSLDMSVLRKSIQQAVRKDAKSPVREIFKTEALIQ